MNRRAAARTATGASSGYAPPTGWPRVAAIGLSVALALVMAQCVRLGLSGLWTHLAEMHMDQWKSAGKPVAIPSIDAVAALLESSLRLTPENPWALEKAAAIQLARIRSYTNPAAALQATEDALQKIRRALQARPSSSFLWANRATAKLYMGQRDDEMANALRLADQLGHWEPAVQEAIVFVGLAAWADLDPQLREAVISSLQRGASRNGTKMYEIAKHFRRQDLVCAMSEYNSISGDRCVTTPPLQQKSRSR